MTHTNTEPVDPWVIIEKLRKQHQAEIHETWMPLVAALRSQLEASQAQRVPLSIEEIMRIYKAHGHNSIEFTRAVEARHSIAQERQGCNKKEGS